MTKLILSAAFLLSLSAHAAQTLVNYRHNAGFSPRPGWTQVSIENDGKVRLHSEYFNRKANKKDITDKVIAKLSSERVDALKALLPKIDEKDLKDQNANSPRCTDAPSSSIAVNDGKDGVELFRKSSCHTWTNETQAAESIKALVDGLVSLAEM